MITVDTMTRPQLENAYVTTIEKLQVQKLRFRRGYADAYLKVKYLEATLELLTIRLAA